MAYINISTQNFEQIISENTIVLIDFWAEWCGPCKMFGPIFEKVSEKHPDILFAKCNTEEASDLATAFDVSSIPMLAIFRESILVYKQAGALPEKSLEDLISQVKNLDMEEVRKQAS